eukprot:257166-Amphidinium_carterae.2
MDAIDTDKRCEFCDLVGKDRAGLGMRVSRSVSSTFAQFLRAVKGAESADHFSPRYWQYTLDSIEVMSPVTFSRVPICGIC